MPGTIPPPRTRSNSVTPDEMRTSSCDSISVKGNSGNVAQLEAVASCPFPRMVSRFSSTSEFHSPHSGHFPSHLRDLCPQFWQTKIVSFFKSFSLSRKGAKK